MLVESFPKLSFSRHQQIYIPNSLLISFLSSQLTLCSHKDRSALSYGSKEAHLFDKPLFLPYTWKCGKHTTPNRPYKVILGPDFQLFVSQPESFGPIPGTSRSSNKSSGTSFLALRTWIKAFLQHLHTMVPCQLPLCCKEPAERSENLFFIHRKSQIVSLVLCLYLCLIYIDPKNNRVYRLKGFSYYVEPFSYCFSFTALRESPLK